MALDYDKYPILGRPPQTAHEHYRVNPLGCDSYPEYCRKVEALMAADAEEASTGRSSNPEARAGVKRRGKRKGGARQG